MNQNRITLDQLIGLIDNPIFINVLYLIFFFLFSFFLSLYSSFIILNEMNTQEYSPIDEFFIIKNDDQIFLTFFLIGIFVFSALAFLIFLKKFFTTFGLLLLDFVVVSGLSSIVFYSFFRPFFDYSSSFFFSLFLGAVFSFLRILKPSLSWLATLFSISGASVVLGLSLNYIGSIIFALLLVIYDFISVYITKHMREFAKILGKHKTSLLISVSHQSLRGYASLQIGAGDFVIPLTLALSFFPLGFHYSLIILFSTSLSFFALTFLLLKLRELLPALPIIVSFNFVSLLLFHFFLQILSIAYNIQT